MQDYKLTDLISVETLQQIQDRFSRFTGIAALTTDADGTPVTQGSGFTDFCMNTVRKSEKGCRLCAMCDRDGAQMTYRSGKTAIYTCHAGLTDFSAPIMVNDEIVGCFVGGQVLTEELDERFVRQHAAELNVDPDEYLTALKKAYNISKEELERSAEFLSFIATILSESAYKNYNSLTVSRKAEYSARSQARFIIDMCELLNMELQDWRSSASEAIVSSKPDEIKTVMRDIMDRCLDMLNLSRDAINYVSMSENDMELAETEYDPVTFIKQLTSGVKSQAQENSIHLVFSVKGDVPDLLFGDTGCMGQIVLKLLSNLISVSSGGVILTEISVNKESYSSDLIVRIENNDIELSPETVNNIRKALVTDKQSEGADEAFIGFTVIGHMARRMSGSIVLNSNAAEGTSFVLTVPQLEVKGGK